MRHGVTPRQEHDDDEDQEDEDAPPPLLHLRWARLRSSRLAVSTRFSIYLALAPQAALATASP